jgi:hypothetical protein
MSTQGYNKIFRLINKLERKRVISWRDVAKLHECRRQVVRATYRASWRHQG